MSENKYLKWLSETDTIWWHDSAVPEEQEIAFSNGAAGITTNPFLVNATLQNNREAWQPLLSSIDQGMSGDDRATALVKTVTGYYADKVMPFYTAGITGRGGVCAQTNPNKTADTEYMVNQAKILASWSPNIVIKLPATAAGIRAYEECVALGYHVAATVSFTVPQVLAAAEARERGKKRAEAAGIQPGLGIAVIMVGRLDDYLREVAKDRMASIKESDIVQAGIACIKRAYEIFGERGYDTFLMPAAGRGSYHVTALSGAKMIMSVAPQVQQLLARENPECVGRIDDRVPSDVIDRLLTINEFRKAFEPNGMMPKDFITYGPTNRTTDQFIQSGWNPLTAYRL